MVWFAFMTLLHFRQRLNQWSVMLRLFSHTSSYKRVKKWGFHQSHKWLGANVRHSSLQSADIICICEWRMMTVDESQCSEPNTARILGQTMGRLRGLGFAILNREDPVWLMIPCFLFLWHLYAQRYVNLFKTRISLLFLASSREQFFPLLWLLPRSRLQRA